MNAKRFDDVADVWTSSNFGISVNVLFVVPSMDATIIGSTAFLAPLTRTVPIKAFHHE